MLPIILVLLIETFKCYLHECIFLIFYYHMGYLKNAAIEPNASNCFPPSC